MHISLGWPLISALHDPHLPALQFQRTARSPAWVACQPVHHVQHDLALLDRDGVVDQSAACRVAAPQPQIQWPQGLPALEAGADDEQGSPALR